MMASAGFLTTDGQNKSDIKSLVYYRNSDRFLETIAKRLQVVAPSTQRGDRIRTLLKLA